VEVVEVLMELDLDLNLMDSQLWLVDPVVVQIDMIRVPVLLVEHRELM
tara:strand:- start:210 stop:353 length:144 start_codon:yes stop_codon:yes gene_type:complete